MLMSYTMQHPTKLRLWGHLPLITPDDQIMLDIAAEVRTNLHTPTQGHAVDDQLAKKLHSLSERGPWVQSKDVASSDE